MSAPTLTTARQGTARGYPFTLRGVTLHNRIAVSPMCQYWAKNGHVLDWHLVHLGSRTIGGAGLVMSEQTAVEARGRITPTDAGIWSDDHVDQLHRHRKKAPRAVRAAKGKRLRNKAFLSPSPGGRGDKTGTDTTKG